jgi:RNA polymerase sigma factor for flagellar operon FliA
MGLQIVNASQNRRIVAGLPFVEALARRMAASMPNSIDVCDLVQDGMIGLIDAAHRFDEQRGIKFETFAERRVRGAMIDALRRDAWPRGVRRQRRELDAAREALRRELGHEPSMADLAARVGSDEKRLSRTIVRINTIEATSPLATGEHFDESCLPTALVPSEPEAPDTAYEKLETRDRVRAAIASLPVRERKVVSLYYYGEATMKEIGSEIGVNESRVSQLHARAIKRLRDALGSMGPQQVSELRKALVEFAAKRPVMAKAERPAAAAAPESPAAAQAAKAIVLAYRPGGMRMATVRTPVKIDRRRQAVAGLAR